MSAHHPLFTRRARHARPSGIPARLAVTSALGGVLVPLALSSPAQAEERAATTTRVSAPEGTVAPGSKAPVTVRLLQGSAYVRDAVVDVQVPEGSGWRTVAQGSTDSSGLARVAVAVSRDTTVRAHYRGSSVRSASTSGSDTIDVAAARNGVLAEAARHRGKPYRYGATGPSAFDCSGFTRYVYAKSTGKSLPHSAAAQEQMARRVSKSAARAGDLVFIQGAGDHVGIYAGNGKMWDAPRSGKTVSLRSIWTSNYTIGRI
ncbi:MAG: hypothetical protein JWO60_32 [Frankiales bacterium]|nr:hypothetical protein [Frankiales bacterium]